jgi:serine/threonine protein phosphatase PrpC
MEKREQEKKHPPRWASDSFYQKAGRFSFSLPRGGAALPSWLRKKAKKENSTPQKKNTNALSLSLSFFPPLPPGAASSQTHAAGVSERVFRVTLSSTGLVAGEEEGATRAAAGTTPFANTSNINKNGKNKTRRVRVRYAAATKAGADPAPPMAHPGTPGPDKQNQDAWLAHERAGGGEALLLGVFDGHGAAGAQVSGLLAARLAGLAAAAGLGRADAGGKAGGVPKKPAPPGGWPAAAGRSASGGFDEQQQERQEQQQEAPQTSSATTATTSAGGLFAGLLGRRAARPPVASCSNASSLESNGPSSPLSSSSAMTTETTTTTTTNSSALHVRRAVPPPPTSAGDALALDAALARAHAAVLAAAEIDATLSGSTAVTLALGPSGLAIAHVGDSRALLGRVLYEEATEAEEPSEAEMMETEEGAEGAAAKNNINNDSNISNDDSVSSEGTADGQEPLQSASSGGDTAKEGGGNGGRGGENNTGSGEEELLGCDDGGEGANNDNDNDIDASALPTSTSEEAHQQHVAARLAAADRRRKQHEKLLQHGAGAGGAQSSYGHGRRNSNDSKRQTKKKKRATLLPALALTSDHVPTRPDEASRIYAHRGRIGAYSDNGVPVGPLRVWLPSVDAPGLCMTRAVGDAVGALAGVSARAEVSARPLSRRDRYLVLVSDGVHEFSTNDEIMSTVHRIALSGGGPAEAAAELVAAAKLQWIAEEWGASDDCTAVVAFLEDDDDDDDEGAEE